MKILVLNCGSSSLKYQLLDMSNNDDLLAIGLVERIGLDDGIISHKTKEGKKFKNTLPIKDHTVAIDEVINALLHSEHGVIKDKNEINAVGHRVVHGADAFSDSVEITDEVIAKMEECVDLAPLHNPANLKGIYAMKDLLPNVPQCGTFDTAFHQTMPEHAYLYALPYEMYEKHRVRRYGFHGASHKYVSERAAKFLNKDYNKIKIITCHLGNGCSITAVKNGESVDTSMGLTPVEGLMMGTRTGNLDLGALFFVMDKENLDVAGANNLVNKKSGLKGISGISNDMRDIEIAADQGNKRATIALEMFAYRVKKYIGAYAAAMGGVDAVVFTGGIGENDSNTRKRVCDNMEYMGLEFNREINDGLRGKLTEISTPSSRVKVLIVPTNEELVIARDTYKIVTENIEA
jgi:acetate kinase